MQLKLRRSQREGGVIAKSVIFCLDARVEFDPTERQSLNRYKLYNQVIYNSEASKQALAKSEIAQDGSIGGSFKSLAYAALAAMKLNISITSLEQGQRVECKSMDELLGAEEAVLDACRNLRHYLETAATFDGREVLIDFAEAEPKVVAQVSTPQPMLVASPAAIVARSPAKVAGPSDGLPPPYVPPNNDDRFGYSEPPAGPPLHPTSKDYEPDVSRPAYERGLSRKKADGDAELIRMGLISIGVVAIIVWALMTFGN